MTPDALVAGAAGLIHSIEMIFRYGLPAVLGLLLAYWVFVRRQA